MAANFNKTKGFDPSMLPVGMRFVGTIHGITYLPSNPMSGDVVYVQDQDKIYAWNGVHWSQVRIQRGPNQVVTGIDGRPYSVKGSSWYTVDENPMTFENKLTYKGISSTIVSEHNIAELFFRQHDLTREDMAFFKMTYPAEFKEFREQWAKKWAIERAKDEFDEWEDDPYEKKRR